MVDFIPACWNWSLEFGSGREGSRRRSVRLLEKGERDGE